MGIKLGVVVALGAPAVAVLLFEIVLNATSMFNHGNVNFPTRLDLYPALDRCHTRHAPGASLDQAQRNEQQLRLQPALVGSPVWHLQGSTRCWNAGMTIGLDQFRDPAELRIDRMLLQPLRGSEVRIRSATTSALEHRPRHELPQPGSV